MKERSKRIVRRWMSTVLIITMLFACVINDISLPYISWARETASASNARNKRVTLVKSKNQEDVQITVLSDEQSYESGDDICLELVITNNSDGEIKDGLLKYSDKSSSGIEADTAYFEDVNDAYVEAVQVIQTGKTEADKADESKTEENGKASEEETAEGSEPEGTVAETEPEADEPETAAPAEDEGKVETTEPENKDEEEKQEVNNEESAATAEENKQEDDEDNEDYPQYLSELNIGPGESYHVNFYYTIDPEIEKIATKGIEFTFRGIKETEDEETEEVKEEKVNASTKFLYTVNAMNLLPVVFTGDEEGKLIRGEEAEMTLDFSLGNLEEILDEWAMENESGEVASPSNGSTDNAASPSNGSASEAKKASDSNAAGNTVGVTDSLIKWEGDKSSSDKDEKPIVQKLHCEVEIPGVQLNDFMVTDDTADGDDYNTSAVCSFQIGRKTKPGTYYGEVKATYEVKDGKRKASGKSTQGIVLVVSQTKDEQVLEVIRLIDELPESDEVMEKIQAFWEAEDDEGEAEYRMDLSSQVQVAYTQYSNLTDEQKEMVDNSEKLLAYVELLGVTTLDITNTITVNCINQYGTGDIPRVMLVHGGKAAPANNEYTYWYVVVVEKNTNGRYYVTKYVKRGTTDMGGGVTKRQFPQNVTNGFVLYCYNIEPDTQEGDEVICFDYESISSGEYNQNGYGTVTFGESAELPYEPTPKPQKYNDLKTLPLTPTNQYIEVNLYDYQGDLNGANFYKGNTELPGFQNPGGTASFTSLNENTYNFGDNLTVDRWGISSLTNKGGNINRTENHANEPLRNAMYPTLIDGYPALKDKTSLSYLFTDGNEVVKKNPTSIDGLFQYDANKHGYWFDSRKNHAEYNDEVDNPHFDLYQQKITSNFMMYPFGNFLPFQSIKTQCKQVKAVDKSYFEELIKSAAYKSNLSEESDYKEAYTKLQTVLTQFVELKKDDSWGPGNLISDYFAKAAAAADYGPPAVEFSNDDPLWENLYSIDYDEKTDFFFGMDMKMKFMQPKDGMVGKGTKYPMEYEFYGDDDVWVYIDDVLFLDLSGIHRHVGGKIDFKNGKIYYYGLNPKTGESDKELKDRTKTFEQILTDAYKGDASYDISKVLKEVGKDANGKPIYGGFKDYSEHSFNFYYMERGSGSGVCKMEFNLMLLDKNSIRVSKELSVDRPSEYKGNPDFSFQILKPEAKEKQPNELKNSDFFIAPNTPYDVYESNDLNQIIRSGTTDANGVFTIKAGQTAVFKEIPENAGKYFVRELLEKSELDQYGKVTVGGEVIGEDKDKEVELDGISFVGKDSPVQDISTGNTMFTYDNQLAVDQFGKLEIKKDLADYDATKDGDLDFEFQVKLDGKLLPEGTSYTINGVSHTIENNDGIITLKPGQTAVIDKIIAGTEFEVKELNAYGYDTEYKINNAQATTGKIATGKVEVNRTVNVGFKNTKLGVDIPVEKRLYNSDGNAHSYNFKLERVANENGDKLSAGEATSNETILVGGDSNSQSQTDDEGISYIQGIKEFHVILPISEIEEGEKVFYYELTEIPTEGDLTTVYDTKVYIIKITVSPSDNGKEITKEYKQKGTEGNFVPIKGNSISFSNKRNHELIIEKKMGGNSTSSSQFKFDVEINAGENAPLEGTVKAQRMLEGNPVGVPEEVIFTAGKAQISLVAGQSLHLYLPYESKGLNWKVTETSTAGYYVTYKIDDGKETGNSTASGSLSNASQKVTFINTPGQELPVTGGPGTLWYTFGGIVLMAFALMYNTLRRKKVLI